jgi:hypothetical protein
VNGISRYTSGAPVNVTLAYDAANIGFGNQRPDRILGQPSRISSPGDKTQGWLNPDAFAAPQQYTFGNLGRNKE